MITLAIDKGGLDTYSEIQDAIDAIPASLADNYTLNYRSSNEAAFSTLINIPSKTMNGFFIYVNAVAGQSSKKSGYDAGIARLEVDPGASGSMVLIECDNIDFSGLQLLNPRIGDGGSYCYRIQGSAANVTIRNTRGRIPDGAPQGALVTGTADNIKFENFIFECTGTQGSNSEGIISNTTGNVIAVNGISDNFNDGLERDAGTFHAYNMVTPNCNTGFDGLTTVDYCMSDAGEGTNPQTPSGADWENEFFDYAAKDFTAVETGNIKDGIGPDSQPLVPTEDMDGDPKTGTVSFMGVDEPSSAEPEAILEDFTAGQAIFESITALKNEVTFSYNDLLGGFSGFFDLLTDVNERRFNVNALWSGIITGTEAKLKTNATATPYIVIVDGIDSNPTVVTGEITLFTGLADTPHRVGIFARQAYSGSGNGININETEVLTVAGSAPVLENIPSTYITDPSFGGQSTESTVATVGGNYAPTWKQSQPYDRERGMIIFNAQIDELYLFTDDVGVWVSVDKGTPQHIVFTEAREFSTIAQRRFAKVSDSLDNTQVHEYRIWYDTRVDYGIQGVVPIRNGAVVPFSAYTDKLVVSQYGDSITDGSEGATVGEADTYLHGIANDYIVQKAGKNGQTSAGLALEIPSIVSASLIADWAILAIGRNDYTNVAGFQADYTACIDALLAAGITKIICRGILPNNSDDARIITMNGQISDIVDARAEEVYFIDTFDFKPIETIDGTHQTATGYVETSAFVSPEIKAIIFPATLEDFTAGQAIFESITASAEGIAELSDFVAGQAVFESITARGDVEIVRSTTISGLITTKTTIKGAL